MKENFKELNDFFDFLTNNDEKLKKDLIDVIKFKLTKNIGNDDLSDLANIYPDTKGSIVFPSNKKKYDIINLANTVKPEIYQLAVDFLRLEIERTEKIGAKNIVLHPGSHVKAGADVGIASIVKGLNEVLTKDMKPNIALEVMAGKGSECGRTFDEIAQIIDGVTLNEKLTVTFDTCHVFEGGYDIVNDLDGVLTEFDKIVGLDRIQVLHINDSKNTLGAHKDRHENIGYGGIGFDAINRIVHLDEFANIPKILETPWYGEKKDVAPYKDEIAMLRSKTFVDFKK